MESVIILSINGTVYFFEAKGITLEQANKMQALADTYCNGSARIKCMDELGICDLFKFEVSTQLGIILNKIQVLSVIRINI